MKEKIASMIYWKLVDRQLSDFSIENMKNSISRTFSHKTFPYDITSEWVKQFLKEMLEYYETCKLDPSWYNLYVGDREKYFLKHYLPSACRKEELEDLIHTLQEAIRNNELLAEIISLAKEIWISVYLKEWNKKVTEDMSLGELLVRLEELGDTVTLARVAAITGLTVRQVQNRIMPMLIEEGFEFEPGRPRENVRKTVQRLVKQLIKIEQSCRNASRDHNK